MNTYISSFLCFKLLVGGYPDDRALTNSYCTKTTSPFVGQLRRFQAFQSGYTRNKFRHNSTLRSRTLESCAQHRNMSTGTWKTNTSESSFCFNLFCCVDQTMGIFVQAPPVLPMSIYPKPDLMIDLQTHLIDK